jgi:hypothetical protein
MSSRWRKSFHASSVRRTVSKVVLRTISGGRSAFSAIADPSAVSSAALDCYWGLPDF